MAKPYYEIEVNSDTSLADLETIISSADATGHRYQDRAGLAKAEIARREKEELKERFDRQEDARIKAQKFQEAQKTRFIEAQEKSMDKQTKVAEGSAPAAMWSAIIATIVIAVLTAFLAWAAFQAID